MSKGKYTNGKLELYVPRYHFMRFSGGMMSGRAIGTGSTEPKTIVYNIEGDTSMLEEGKRYRFEVIDKEKKIVKIVS
jgi:hypothetical protein